MYPIVHNPDISNHLLFIDSENEALLKLLPHKDFHLEAEPAKKEMNEAEMAKKEKKDARCSGESSPDHQRHAEGGAGGCGEQLERIWGTQ